MQEEFRKIKQNFKLNTSYFNKKQKRNLELIMKDPCKFVSKARFKQSKLSQILRHPKKIFQILFKIN